MAGPEDWGAVAVEDPGEWGAVAVPSLGERAKLHAKETLASSGLGLMARWLPYPEITANLVVPGAGAGIRTMNLPKTGEARDALRQQYEEMPGAQGFLERAVAVGSSLGAGFGSPENLVPVGRGASLAVRAAKTAGTVGGINAALNAGEQLADIKEGRQKDFNWGELGVQSLFGATVGGLAHLGIEALGGLGRRAAQLRKSGDLKPAEKETLDKIIAEVDAEVGRRQETGDGGQVTGAEGVPADVPEVTLNSKDRRLLRRQAAREAGDGGDAAVAQRYDELAAGELEKRAAAVKAGEEAQAAKTVAEIAPDAVPVNEPRPQLAEQTPAAVAAEAGKPAGVAGAVEDSSTAKVVKTGKRPGVGLPADGEPDVLNALEEIGGIRSPKAVSNPGGEYDGFAEAFNSPDFRGPQKLLVNRRTKTTPDDAIAQLAEMGHKFDSPDAMYDAIKAAVTRREGLRKSFAAGVQREKFYQSVQAAPEERAVHRGQPGKTSTQAAGLKVGDRFKVNREPVKVTDIDPDTGAAIVEDGDRFPGKFTLPEGSQVTIDKGSLKRAPKAKGADAWPEEMAGFISARLAGSIAGGGVGAGYGLTQGDTPQERVENALFWGGIGLASPWVLGGIARRAPKLKKLPGDLEEIAGIFKSPEKPSKWAAVKQAPRDLYRALVSEYQPLARAETVLRAAAGLPRATLSLARKFELLHGAAGKAEADLARFDRAVAEPIRGMEREFNIYAFLKRTASRLEQQNVNAEAAKGAEAKVEAAWNAARDALKEKPGFLNAKREMKAREALKAARAETEKAASSRKVGNYTLEDINKRLDSLRAHLGEERWALFEATGKAYQQHMDDVLKLAQLSGRLSEEEVAAIRGANDFYAPFRVLKHVDDADMAGKSLNRGELFQRIKGVSQEDLQLEDILVASRENIYRNRILAEKNLKMQELAGLAGIDKEGQFVRVLGHGEEPRKGYQPAKVFMDGREVSLEVSDEIAKGVHGLNTVQTGLVAKTAALAAAPFRMGATAANLSFQSVNLALADQPRLALISRYGLFAGRTLPERVMNTLRWPMDFTAAIASSMHGNFGGQNALYTQWLESGAARSTIQDHVRGLGNKAAAGIAPGERIRQVRGVVDGVGALANAIEETTKIMGLKRGLRAEGWHAGLTAKQQQAIMDRVASEVRNYAGSPDFGRRGTHTRNANLLFMFFNARIQGVEADLRRLGGADGRKVAAATWAKLAGAIGTPTVALWYVNQRAENARDYALQPKEKRENYWLIPRYDEAGRPLYEKNDEGQRVRQWYAIPKRETGKLFANMTESFMDFAKARDPQSLWQFGVSFMENVSPVSVSGRNFEERIESVIGSTNPLVKAPIQLGMGRNTFFHRDTISERLQGGFGGVSPELQFTESTPELFKRAAVAMPDFLPERLRSPLYLQQLTQDLSAGLITQFATGKLPEGAPAWSGLPGMKRFVGSSYTVDEPLLDVVRKEDRAETDERLVRMRAARDLADSIKELPSGREKAAAFVAAVQKDPKMVEALKDTVQADARGLTGQDRIVLGLGVESGARARFYKDVTATMSPEERRTYLLDQIQKKMLTKDVAKQLAVLEMAARRKGKP